ncbi:solute carrier family 23 member 1-like isoform X2 [Mya arenaria]|uniref:solute carrier family 23 member 1-like isoform X2 n=1 Tax=Mya arenaria TaxID=6604 RepID=UPI0022E3D190|nr:solute carrier family 23 member 1-like isoform X2 [Mya arenaria]
MNKEQDCVEKEPLTNGGVELHDIHNDSLVKAETEVDNEDEPKIIEDFGAKLIIYGVNETPPLHVTLVCAMQQSLSALASQLIVSLLVADVVCASQREDIKARLLSSTLLMSGVTTLLMNLIGIRLPLFQGATTVYIIPLLLMSGIDDTFCTGRETDPGLGLLVNNMTNETLIHAADVFEERIFNNIRSLQGSLMAAGVMHGIIGATGLIGLLLRFIGPLTIVPTMILIFVFFVKTVLKFVVVSWAISLSTVCLSVILFLYLSRYNMPLPVWTPSGGCRVIRYPLHQIFAILISIVFHWLICGLLTAYDVFPNDPTSPSFNARTDARSDIIYTNPWIATPYPGQYGPVSISSSALLAFFIATLISILDSIGDYYACARVCRVPPPPAHGVNRGIMIEGLCTFLSGTVGCGHATSTYGGNIGAIGVSKVASRTVFIWSGIIYILFGFFGKFSAFFITIPYPVLGGSFVVMIGIFFGVVISNLEVTNMSSPRNIAILGLSVLIGLAVPTWAQASPVPIHTGNDQFDQIVSMFLKNPNTVGTVIAFFLDNTVPGTIKERGMFGQEEASEDEVNVSFNEGYEVYDPLFPKKWLSWKLVKYLPFFPYMAEEMDSPA